MIKTVMILLFILLILIIIELLCVAKKKNPDAKCAIGFLLVLLGIAIQVIGGYFLLSTNNDILLIVGGIEVIIIIAGMVFAIKGLIKVRRAGYKKGRILAIMAIILGVWVLYTYSTYILSGIADTKKFNRLIVELEDKDPMVRFNAIGALSEMNDDRATGFFSDALKDKNIYVRRGAVVALQKSNDVRAIEPLIAVLKDKDSEIHMEAASALGKIGAPAIKPLIAALEDMDGNARGHYSARALGEIGVPAITPLIMAIKSEKTYIRAIAINALAEINDARSIDPLIRVLKDTDKEVRGYAILALIKKGAPTISALIAALKDKDLVIRKYAATVLGLIKDVRASNVLFTALVDKDLNIIAGAHVFFIERGITKTEEILIKALIQYGDEVMAIHFHNCGNNQLEQAARQWAIKNGMELPVKGEGPQWGEELH